VEDVVEVEEGANRIKARVKQTSATMPKKREFFLFSEVAPKPPKFFLSGCPMMMSVVPFDYDDTLEVEG
jgi:hypothetical protein